MSKKTFYTLGRIAMATALIGASTVASAANCSTSYCFVSGTTKITTSLIDFQSIQDLFGIKLIPHIGSTTSIQAGPANLDGYIPYTISSPITKVSFSSNPQKISIAQMEGSGFIFQRGPQSQSTSLRNLSAKLQSAPAIVSISSDIEGKGVKLTNTPSIWNLNGGGIDSITYSTSDSNEYFQSTTSGNGLISSTPESDGYYHARLTVTAVGFVGTATTQAPWGTQAYGVWYSGLGWQGTILAKTLESLPIGSLELDMRFTAVKP